LRAADCASVHPPCTQLLFRRINQAQQITREEEEFQSRSLVKLWQVVWLVIIGVPDEPYRPPPCSDHPVGDAAISETAISGFPCATLRALLARLAFDDLQEDTHQPEFLEAYEGSGEDVQLDEGARSNCHFKTYFC
jgi:hypothetical protein